MYITNAAEETKLHEEAHLCSSKERDSLCAVNEFKTTASGILKF